MTFRVALDECAPENANDVAALEQREVERNFRDFAGGKPDHQKAALPGDRAQRGFRVCTADGIVNYVSTFAAGCLAQRVLQIRGCVIDDVVGAALAAERELVVG